MTRNIFGWDLPPGCTQRHIDEAAGGNEICNCCGNYAADCICPECPRCGCSGSEICYGPEDSGGHGLDYSLDQQIGRAQMYIVHLESQLDDARYALQLLKDRKQDRLRAVQTDEPVCVGCGQTEPYCICDHYQPYSEHK